MKAREKNPVLKSMVENLRDRSFREKKPILLALAKGLNRPKRQGHEVNVDSIEKYAKAKENVVVPGSVLGTGSISKAVNVYALRFSESAREKIEKSGGKCLSIEEFAEKTPKARIMG
ncbi:MAG: 50S ribosomal protein L18e [Candidatus Aenigmarchaeota archaeon]|nr:50S ribosomal protein L18e [Candidatus Aenigmarchaeota archaeon]